MYDNNEAMKISKYPILEKLKGYIFTNYCPVGKKKEMKQLRLERK